MKNPQVGCVGGRVRKKWIWMMMIDDDDGCVSKKDLGPPLTSKDKKVLT